MASSAQPLQSQDRVVMEAERLARLKRRADDGLEETRSKSIRLDSKSSTDREISPPPVSRRPAPSSLKFPNGTVKRTWAFKFPRVNDIKVEEVLQKQDLNIAVLSSYTWDMSWLLDKLNLTRTKLVLVMQARDEAARATWRKEAAEMSKSLRLCFPPMPQSSFSTMHSKLMLLFFDDFLRVVVPSANLIGFDWGETGVMENTVFLIDLPRLQEASSFTETIFSDELVRFVKALGLDKDVQLGILKFDFSATKDIAFIHTIAGSHTGENWAETGVAQLSRAVQLLGLQSESKTPMEINSTASSIGDLDEKFLQTLSSALRGIDRPKYTPGYESMRIHFPSIDTVRESVGGSENGGTLFLQPKYWEKSKFPRDIFHEYHSSRPGLLSHNKLIFVRTDTKAFFYTGSANLSKAAWGNITYAGQQPKLYAGNWECGVLMPVARPAREEDIDTEDDEPIAAIFKKPPAKKESQSSSILPMSVFAPKVDVPFQHPAARYGPTAKPWCASMMGAALH